MESQTKVSANEKALSAPIQIPSAITEQDKNKSESNKNESVFQLDNRDDINFINKHKSKDLQAVHDANSMKEEQVVSVKPQKFERSKSFTAN